MKIASLRVAPNTTIGISQTKVDYLRILAHLAHGFERIAVVSILSNSQEHFSNCCDH